MRASGEWPSAGPGMGQVGGGPGDGWPDLALLTLGPLFMNACLSLGGPGVQRWDEPKENALFLATARARFGVAAQPP
jgi:hypothetical protein